jgi:hypothetical protein
MINKIYITRGSASGLQYRGLSAVFVWFHEPCLEVSEVSDSDDVFGEYTLRNELNGILYGHNCRYNFLYREENDTKSNFGNKIVRNDDGIDLPQILVDLMLNAKLYFTHKVFGDGPKSGYRTNTVVNLFGYDSLISNHIWKLVCDDFNGIDFMDWDKHDKTIPSWKFCKEVEIEINLVK